MEYTYRACHEDMRRDVDRVSSLCRILNKWFPIDMSVRPVFFRLELRYVIDLHTTSRRGR